MTKVLNRITDPLHDGTATSLTLGDQEREPFSPASAKSEGGYGSARVSARVSAKLEGEFQKTSGKVAQLRKIFDVAETVEKEQEELAALHQLGTLGFMKYRMTTMSWSEVEVYVDLFVGFMIVLNAILIGLHMDHPDPEEMWLAVDIVFSATFILELTFKICLHGFKGQFFGEGYLANCFDAFLIVLDLAQMMLELLFPGIAKELSNAPSASLFRIIRLARLARLVRAMKADIFRSLSEMIHGIAAGLGTLAWSVVLFFFCVYVSALVLREGLGRADGKEPVEHVTEMFSSVPRSLYTMFRCSFGDCSSLDGTPIFEQVMPTQGLLYVLFYSGITFITTVVIFNVISAMFVESTMSAAAALQNEKKRAKMQDEKLLYSTIAFLVRKILHYSPQHEVPSSLTQSLGEIINDEVPLSVIDETIKDPEVKRALDKLDINPQDHARLSDIFDPDNGGTVELLDVATGLRRLRGDPRRSDIVCVDLMIRSMQFVLKDILEGVQQLQNVKR
eukprot:TRINITY_DN10448_c0_g1_i2.p1 TRINITY_DN10448_c0_g1~~TRINITY_DN10448_c0_g1_i2.p1  ORF type:complete len:505 (+),score=86.93 TRINITY_DN10448_c0_g1_i2:250-1764(+)